MTKSKKYILAIGTAATVVAPLATVVACGSNGSKNSVSSGITITSQKFNDAANEFLPTQTKDWYNPVVSKRFYGDAGKGIEFFGLTEAVWEGKYSFDSLASLISYEVGYLQSGKLLMLSYYGAHPNTKTTELTSNIDELSAVYEKKLKELQKTLTQAQFKGTKATEIYNALNALDFKTLYTSKPSSLSSRDYLGFKGIDSIFSTLDISKDLNKDDAQATTKFISKWLSEARLDLVKLFSDSTPAQNISRASAYDELMGISWNPESNMVGNRKAPSPFLQNNNVNSPLTDDHNDLLSDVTVGGAYTKDLKILVPVKGGKNTYGSQLWRHAATTNVNNNAAGADAFNSAVARGIEVVTTGSKTSDKAGQVTSTIKRHLEFGLFDKVTIKDSNNADHVFDKDTTISPGNDNINGAEFKRLIKTNGVKKLSFHVRTGQKWMSDASTQTSHTIKPMDFWYNIQQQTASSDRVEHSVKGSGGEQVMPSDKENGVSNTIANAIQKSFADKDIKFTEPSKSSATSPLYWDSTVNSIFGLKSGTLLDGQINQNNFIANDSVNFEFQDSNNGVKLKQFWNKKIASVDLSNPILALPSELIKEDVAVYTGNSAIRGLTGYDENAPLIKYGVFYKYLHSKTTRTTTNYGSVSGYEYAGKYIVAKNEDQQMKWDKNAHYSNNAWNNVNAPTSLTREFVDKSGAWTTNARTQFESGKTYKLLLSDKDLSSYLREILLKTEQQQKDFGLKYIKGKTSKGTVQGRFAFLALPFDNKNAVEGNYFFNDNFAKVMYGSNIKELFNKNDGSNVEYMFKGHGLAFRSSLQAAINWDALLTIRDSRHQSIGATFAPELKVGGTGNGNDQDVIDTGINNIVGFSSTGGQTSVSFGELANTFGEGNEKYLIPDVDKLAQLKSNIKAAIDAANIPAGQKLVSELPWDYAMSLATKRGRDLLEAYRIALNSLDSRLEFVAKVDPKQLNK